MSGCSPGAGVEVEGPARLEAPRHEQVAVPAGLHHQIAQRVKLMGCMGIPRNDGFGPDAEENCAGQVCNLHCKSSCSNTCYSADAPYSTTILTENTLKNHEIQ